MTSIQRTWTLASGFYEDLRRLQGPFIALDAAKGGPNTIQGISSTVMSEVYASYFNCCVHSSFRLPTRVVQGKPFDGARNSLIDRLPIPLRNDSLRAPSLPWPERGSHYLSSCSVLPDLIAECLLSYARLSPSEVFPRVMPSSTEYTLE